jgi:hypothetical protein
MSLRIEDITDAEKACGLLFFLSRVGIIEAPSKDYPYFYAEYARLVNAIQIRYWATNVPNLMMSKFVTKEIV